MANNEEKSKSENEEIEIDNDLKPFELVNIIGFDKSLGIRTLSTKFDENYILYSLGHVATIADINTKSTRKIIGHKFNIIAAENDMNGKFLITADKETVIIWDVQDLKQNEASILRIIHKPFGNNDSIEYATISPCGKYLIITNGNIIPDGEYNLQFWLWSFDREKFDDEFYFKQKYGKIKSIRFSLNTNEEEFFAITLTHLVIFGNWNIKKKMLKFYIPDIKLFKQINETCYIPNNRYVASVTERGQFLVWSDDLNENSNKLITNDKMFIKTMPIVNCPVNDIKIHDNYIVTVDDAGGIRFFDVDLKLIYICVFDKKLPSIKYIYPLLRPRQYKLVDVDYNETDDDIEIIYKSTCPTDFTVENNRFIVRNFFLISNIGEILFCDAIKKTCQLCLYHFEDFVVGLDHHPLRTWLIACTLDRRIIFYDYKQCTRISEYILQPHLIITERETKEIVNPNPTIIKISRYGNHIALGYENGSLWMIDSTTAIPIYDKPMRFSHYPIKKIVFSSHSRYCAYYDENYTIVLLHWETDWTFVGKYRYHCKPIVNVIFTEFNNEKNLITIGEDRLFVEYDILESIKCKKLILKRDIRLEQSAIITAAELVPSSILQKDTSSKGQVILTANNQNKFVIFDAFTVENLFTFAGPIFDTPIKHIIYNESEEGSFLIVGSDKTLGIVVNPIDGNAFRYSGVIAHSKKIKLLALSMDKNRIYVLGNEDAGATVWNIQRENAIKYFQSGGVGLLPFCNFLPGGKKGWLFNEMQDLFYYMQILSKGIESSDGQTITDYIKISDLADYMRGIGYYPSEFEIKNMINEATRVRDELAIIPTEISFEDIVKMYLNHKLSDDAQQQKAKEEIMKSIQYFANTEHISKFANYFSNDISENGSKSVTYSSINESENPTKSIQSGPEQDQNAEFTSNTITKEKLLEILTDTGGETIPKDLAMKYVIQLSDNNESKISISNDDIVINDEFNNLPNEFNIQELYSNLLGNEIPLTEKNQHSNYFDVIDSIITEDDHQPDNSDSNSILEIPNFDHLNSEIDLE